MLPSMPKTGYQQSAFEECRDGSLAPDLAEDLNYCKGMIPLSMLLEKQSELYSTFGGDTVPYGIVRPGRMMGFQGVFPSYANIEYYPLVDLSAGIKTFHLLPRMSNRDGLNRMMNYAHLRLQKNPKFELVNFRHFMTQVVRKHCQSSAAWLSPFLVFGGQWLDHKRDSDVAWQHFYNYLADGMASNLQFFMRNVFFDNLFSKIRGINKSRHAVNISESVKQLCLVASGVTTGYVPATDTQALPLDAFQDIYENIYNASEYLPSVLQPVWVDQLIDTDCPMLYYSFAQPSLLSNWPRKSQGYSIISDMSEIQYLLKRYMLLAKNELASYHKSEVLDRLDHMQFDYYHSEAVRYPEIQPTANIGKEDKRFQYRAIDSDKALLFSENAPFIKGCARLKYIGRDSRNVI